VRINAIGGDCPVKTELARGDLVRSDIFVEYAAQTRIEGDIRSSIALTSSPIPILLTSWPATSDGTAQC
jgi:ornithine cyclodeaminase/alanine dehydrogenase-like protein (mu-crystallin family)